MTSPILGAGLCPAGTSFLGFGSPSTVDSSFGEPAAARYIDVSNGDYSIDEAGHMAAMGGTAQRVQLALTTALGSAAIEELGLDIEVETWSADVPAKLQDAVNLALAGLISDGSIAVSSVTTVRVGSNGILTTIHWTDVTTGLATKTTVGGA